MRRLGWALALWWRAASVGGESTYDILALFYRTTNGDNWYHNEGWLVGDPCDGTWMTTSKYDCYSGELTDSYQPICCELVSQTDTSPRVVKLDLHENNLEGTIPDELVRFPLVMEHHNVINYSLELCLIVCSAAAHGTQGSRPGWQPDFGDLTQRIQKHVAAQCLVVTTQSNVWKHTA